MPGANDSLDAMRLDFLADYNHIMKDGSDEFVENKKFMSDLKHSLTEQKAHKGGALNQMVAAGNMLKNQASEEMNQLRNENE